jgi:hypothetical protein
MSNRDHLSAIQTLMRKFYHQPPLLPGEDAAKYGSFVADMIATYNPATLRETMLVHDIAHAQWEMIRLRSIAPAMVKAEMGEAFRSLVGISYVAHHPDAEFVAKLRACINRVQSGDDRAEKEADHLLGRYGLNVGDLAACAFGKVVGPQTQTDRMFAAAKARRDSAMVEIDRLQEKRVAATKKGRQSDTATGNLPAIDDEAVTTAPTESDGEVAAPRGRKAPAQAVR